MIKHLLLSNGIKINRLSSQQQNALGYNLSMQGIGTVAIDAPRFEELLRSRKDFAVGLHSWVNKL